jgi:hypothetical protein
VRAQSGRGPSPRAPTPSSSAPPYPSVALFNSSFKNRKSFEYCFTAPCVFSSIFVNAAPTLTPSGRSSISLTAATASQ